MTVKTLTYIHNLLKEDANDKETTMNFVRTIYNEAVRENKPTAEHIREQYQLCRDKYWEAREALEDFERKEW